MPMPRRAGSDHLPLQNVERGEQWGRSMPLIIVRLSCWPAGPQGKHGLRALQGLNLALLIHAEDDRLIRWVYIEPHNVAHFASKFRIVTEQEGLPSMGGSLCFFQIRCTVAGLSFWLAAMART